MACHVQSGRQNTPLTENHARERKSKQFWLTGTNIEANMACHVQNRREYGLSRPKWTAKHPLLPKIMVNSPVGAQNLHNKSYGSANQWNLGLWLAASPSIG